MIYRKDANFPYPLLSNNSNSYEDNHFLLDVNISEIANYYRFEFNYEIESKFIRDLLYKGLAQPILIVQSRDNKFYKIRPGQSKVDIPKSRISINRRTSIQIHIQALDEIIFKDNRDLNSFYTQFKEELSVPKYSLLGYSNVVVFDGNMKKPFELFERKVNENLTSEIKIELGRETIIIHYKNRDYQLQGLPNAIQNVYVYTGLTKALQNFVINNSDDGEVYLVDITEPESSLDFKLYNLMKSKNVEEVNMDNIDEVISLISDQIIDKYSTAVRRLEVNGG